MDQTPAEQTASAVRAEMARQRVNARQLSLALGWSINTTRRRLNGVYPFDIDQIVAVAHYLKRPVVHFLPDSERAA